MAVVGTSGLFPKSKYEAIAYLYIQNQDLSDKTPTEIYDMYQAALSELEKNRKDTVKQNTSRMKLSMT